MTDRIYLFFFSWDVIMHYTHALVSVFWHNMPFSLIDVHAVLGSTLFHLTRAIFLA
jgi:hypothetical protein